MSRKIIYIVLFLLYFAISVLKINLSFGFDRFNYSDDTGYFYTESAFHYRYSKMIARGKSIPVIDYQAQFPEGIEVFKEFSLVPEFFYGLIYRYIFSRYNIPFHVYLIIAISFFSSLNIFVVYYYSKKLWSNEKSAILSAIVYGLSITAFSRTVGWFNYEDFTLPFLFLSLLIFRATRLSHAIVLTFFFSFALISWHLISLYLTILSIIFAIKILLEYPNIRQLIYKLVIFYIILFIIGSLNTSLIKKQFLLSPGMIMLSTILSVYILFVIFKLKNKSLFVGINLVSILGILFIIVHFNIIHFSDFSHIYELIKYKLIFAGYKPEDPSLIPFQVRMYWLGPYSSSNLSQFLNNFSPSIILLIPVVFIEINKLISNLYKRKLTFVNTALLLLFTNLILYVFFNRFRVFLLFFICVISGKFVLFLNQKNTFERYVIYLIVFFVLVLQTVTLGQIVHSNGSIRNILDVRNKKSITDGDMELVLWIKENIDKRGVILTPYVQLGSYILAYTDINIVLNSQFEELNHRKKIEEVLNALYDKEQNFLSVTEKYSIEYVIYDASLYYDIRKNSWRYITNHLDYIDKNSLIYLFQFQQNNLNNFKLVGEVNKYKIFQYKRLKT